MKNVLIIKEINSLFKRSLFYVYCSRENGTHVTDAAIHRMQWARTDNTVRSLDHSGSPRALSPSDDKEWKEIVVSTICHCEEGAEADDAAIH